MTDYRRLSIKQNIVNICVEFYSIPISYERLCSVIQSGKNKILPISQLLSLLTDLDLDGTRVLTVRDGRIIAHVSHYINLFLNF